MHKEKPSIIFLVQGEGRGHMTQAISLAQLLKRNGHALLHVFVGSSQRRKVPSFFSDAIDAQIETIASPNFELDTDNKSLRIFPSIIKNFRNGKVYLCSLDRMKEVIDEKSPDLVVNFYDILGGLYFIKHKKGAFKYFCVGHQYMASHRDFTFPKRKTVARLSFHLLNFLTSYRADKIVALSFSQYAPFKKSKKHVTPPLLREAIRNKESKEGDYILVYVVNDGYGFEILSAHQHYADQQVYCFWDNKTHPDGYTPEPNFTFYQLNGERFVDLMSNAKGYIATSGFESVCEAMYLGKKLMVVPVENHFEQACNALDAVKTGLCISNDSFDLGKLLDFVDRPNYAEKQKVFKSWVDSADTVFSSIFSSK